MYPLLAVLLFEKNLRSVTDTSTAKIQQSFMRFFSNNNTASSGYDD